jgi:putative Holliday junction resolvase
MLGIDLGRKRIGLALSDPSGTLARPWKVVPHAPSLKAAIEEIATTIEALAAEDDGLGGIVVGVPKRLDGSATDETPHALAFADGLRARLRIPLTVVDERLTSVEAESRLAVRERDWKKRKAQLDAAAAAVILQEYLDTR